MKNVFLSLVVFRVCRVFVCSLLPVVTCLEIADLFALLCVMFCCVFVAFPCGILGQAWCLIVLIPDHSLLCYFYRMYLDVLG